MVELLFYDKVISLVFSPLFKFSEAFFFFDWTASKNSGY